MAYATASDLIAKYGEDFVLLCFDRIGNGSVDLVAVDASLEDASALIDTYIGARYVIPLDPVPPILLAICRDIAVYMGSPDAASLTEEKRQRYTDAVTWLADVRDGKADINGAEEVAIALEAETVGPFITRVSSSPIVFTRHSLRGLF